MKAFKFLSMLLTIISLLSCSGNGSEEIPGPVKPEEKPKTITVSLSLGGEYMSTSESPMGRSDNASCVYGINVYYKDENSTSWKHYGYGLFDNTDDMKISLIASYKYKFDCTMTEDNVDKVSYTGTILTHQNSTQTAVNRGHIYIFSNHNAYNGTGGIQNMSAMRLYRFTMIQDDIYIRDFIPCRRKSDSKVGLFDLVTGQFYTSPVGNFTAGSVVTNKDITAKFLSGGSIQARQFIEI